MNNGRKVFDDVKTISSAQQVMTALNVLKKQEFKENEAINYRLY